MRTANSKVAQILLVPGAWKTSSSTSLGKGLECGLA